MPTKNIPIDKIELTKFRKDIDVICDYLELDEKKHYEESGQPQNHIWCYIKRVKQWLKRQ